MAEDNDSDDQLNEFIHSYSYPEYDAQAHSSDGDDASCSDSGSEPPEDPSAEAEDMEIYDLYDNSARPSPHPPSSPILQEGMLELDSALDTIDEEPKSLHPGWRKRVYGPQNSFPPPAGKAGDVNPTAGDSSESGIETSDDEESKE